MLTFYLDKLITEKDFKSSLMLERDSRVKVNNKINGVTLRRD